MHDADKCKQKLEFCAYRGVEPLEEVLKQQRHQPTCMHKQMQIRF
jgi:hypothetical protein